jgi:hypothetical protein
MTGYLAISSNATWTNIWKTVICSSWDNDHNQTALFDNTNLYALNYPL